MDNFGQNEQEGALSPRWFIVQPPVKATPIPVLRDPTNATSVIARLKADTVVKSVSQSAMWLRIELPKSQFGYIQIALTRPLTADELVEVDRIQNAQGVSNGSALRTTSQGLTGAGAGSRKLRQSSAGLFAALSLVSCAIGAFLTQIEEQQCITYGFGGTSCQTIAHPYASMGGVLFLIAFGLLVVAFIAAIVWFSKPMQAR